MKKTQLHFQPRLSPLQNYHFSASINHSDPSLTILLTSHSTLTPPSLHLLRPLSRPLKPSFNLKRPIFNLNTSINDLIPTIKDLSHQPKLSIQQIWQSLSQIAILSQQA